jgi:hypothetical protein
MAWRRCRPDPGSVSTTTTTNNHKEEAADMTDEFDERDDPDDEAFEELLRLRAEGVDVEDQLDAMADRRVEEHRAFWDLAVRDGASEPEPPIHLAGVVSDDPRTPEARSARLADPNQHTRIQIDCKTGSKVIYRPGWDPIIEYGP